MNKEDRKHLILLENKMNYVENDERTISDERFNVLLSKGNLDELGYICSTYRLSSEQLDKAIVFLKVIVTTQRLSKQ